MKFKLKSASMATTQNSRDFMKKSSPPRNLSLCIDGDKHKERKHSRSPSREKSPKQRSPPLQGIEDVKDKLHQVFVLPVRQRTNESLSPVSSPRPSSPLTIPQHLFLNKSLATRIHADQRRELSLEEELQARLHQVGEAARTWQHRYTREREETARLTHHLSACETHCQSLVENLTKGYEDRTSKLEHKLKHALRLRDELLQEKSSLEHNFRRMMEMNTVEKRDLETKTQQLNDSTLVLKERLEASQRLNVQIERENEGLISETQKFKDNISQLQNSTNDLRAKLVEADIRSECYQQLLEVAMGRLRVLEEAQQLSPGRSTSTSAQTKQYILRMDSKEPTQMYVEDTLRACQQDLQRDSDSVSVSSSDCSVQSPMSVSQDGDMGQSITEDKSGSDICNQLSGRHRSVSESVSVESEVSDSSNKASSDITVNGARDVQCNSSGSTENSFKIVAKDNVSLLSIPVHVSHLGKEPRASSEPRTLLLPGIQLEDARNVCSDTEGKPPRPKPRKRSKLFLNRADSAGELPRSQSSLCIDGESQRAQRTDLLRPQRSATLQRARSVTLNDSDCKTLPLVACTSPLNDQHHRVRSADALDRSPSTSMEDLAGSRTSGFSALRSRRNGIIDVPEDFNKALGKQLKRQKSKDLTDILKHFRRSGDHDNASEEKQKSSKKTRSVRDRIRDIRS